MRDYELTVLLKPSLAEKDLAHEIKVLADILEKSGAKVSRKDDVVKKTLAYAINKTHEAYLLYFEAAVLPAEAPGIEQKLKLMENVVRYMLIKKE
jgi:small subunit ribosomal protein S6